MTIELREDVTAAEAFVAIRLALRTIGDRLLFDKLLIGLESSRLAILRVGEVMGVFVKPPDRHLDLQGRPACGRAAAGALVVERPAAVTCRDCGLLIARLRQAVN